MSNIRIRLLFFIVALPSLFVIVLYLPHLRYLAFNSLVILMAGFASRELTRFFKNKKVDLSPRLAFFIAAVGPLCAYLEILSLIPENSTLGAYVLISAVLLAKEIFNETDEAFAEVLPRLSAYFFLLIYPGLFGVYAVRITSLPHAKTVILVFLVGTYLNDSAAWAAGMLWGGNNRNILKVSPNKSLVGFIFGFIASIIVFIFASIFFPASFPFSLPFAGLFGAVIGITSMLGDLAESAMKRSGTVKDSGTIIPGRGGFLDSIDSPLFNAPIFFYLFLLLSWLSGLSG